MNSYIDTLDENNTTEINVRLINIINQIGRSNKGIQQPIKILNIMYIINFILVKMVITCKMSLYLI